MNGKRKKHLIILPIKSCYSLFNPIHQLCQKNCLNSLVHTLVSMSSTWNECLSRKLISSLPTECAFMTHGIMLGVGLQVNNCLTLLVTLDGWVYSFFCGEFNQKILPFIFYWFIAILLSYHIQIPYKNLNNQSELSLKNQDQRTEVFFMKNKILNIFCFIAHTYSCFCNYSATVAWKQP